MSKIVLTESDKVKFRKFIRKNWSDIVEELRLDASLSKKDVEKVLDSLHCYILFTDKDKDMCLLSKLKKHELKSAKTIKRKCVVCGKNTRMNVDKKGHYDNGHYFGKMKIPIKGTGEHKKVGTTRFLKKKINVVKWTGEEKEVEYWECNKCYEKAMYENWLEELIEKLYGKRCKDYEAGCGCCQAWSVFDTIIEENRGKL